MAARQPRVLVAADAPMALDQCRDLSNRHAAVRGDRNHAEPCRADRIETRRLRTQCRQLPEAARASQSPRAAESEKAGTMPLADMGAWYALNGATSAGARPNGRANEIYVALPRPGGDAWLSIDRESGEVRYERTNRGWISYLNDLHKGRNTGVAWSLFLDVFASPASCSASPGLVLLQLNVEAPAGDVAGRRPGACHSRCCSLSFSFIEVKAMRALISLHRFRGAWSRLRFRRRDERSVSKFRSSMLPNITSLTSRYGWKGRIRASSAISRSGTTSSSRTTKAPNGSRTCGNGGAAVRPRIDHAGGRSQQRDARARRPSDQLSIAPTRRRSRVFRLVRYHLVIEAAREVGGREMLRMPFQWPVRSAENLKVQGGHELATIELQLKP